MSSALGLMVIVALYIAIGGMSAAGSVYLSKLIFSAKQEQIFFGLFLIPIAGFYLAFAAHFGNKDAWPLESTAVAVFSVLGLVGIRVPFVLIVGYLLHGVWDGIRLFCEGLSLCPRTHSFRRDDTDILVFCFADRAHAEQFRERFGGEFINPKSRPKWPGSNRC